MSTFCVTNFPPCDFFVKRKEIFFVEKILRAGVFSCTALCCGIVLKISLSAGEAGVGEPSVAGRLAMRALQGSCPLPDRARLTGIESGDDGPREREVRMEEARNASAAFSAQGTGGNGYRQGRSSVVERSRKQCHTARSRVNGSRQATREPCGWRPQSIFVLKMLSESSEAGLRRDAPPSPVSPQFTCGVKRRRRRENRESEHGVLAGRYFQMQSALNVAARAGTRPRVCTPPSTWFRSSACNRSVLTAGRGKPGQVFRALHCGSFFTSPKIPLCLETSPHRGTWI